MTTTLEMLLRLGTGVALGTVIGFERQYRARMAGLRTNALVAGGATLFVLLSAHGFGGLPDGGSADPTRVAAQIVSGIGFLGAGALIRSNDRVFGFTTAALVWAMAALGVAAGAGLYLLVAVDYAIVWAVVVTDRVLEGKGFGSHAKVVRVTVANPVTPEELDALLPAGLTHFERVHVDKEAHRVNVTAEVRIRPADVSSLLDSLRSNDKVRAFELE